MKINYNYYKWNKERNNYFNFAYFLEKHTNQHFIIDNLKRVKRKGHYYTRVSYFKIIKKTRQQVVYNAEYGNSIRAIGYNHKYTEDNLETAILEFLKSNPNLLHFGFESAGYEDEEIDDSEDKGLNKNIINLQLNDRDISLMSLNRK